MNLKKYAALALVTLLAADALATASASDLGDSDDDAFWQDAPPKADSRKFDPQSGRFKQTQTIRFFEARLRPDSTRTMEEAVKIAEDLQDAFLYEGMSHNNATASSPHQISIESLEAWEEIQDVVFSIHEIYDVVVKSKALRRDGEKVPFKKLWKKEFGNAPEPLAERFEKLAPGQMPDFVRESLAQGKATPELEEMLADAFAGKVGVANKFKDVAAMAEKYGGAQAKEDGGLQIKAGGVRAEEGGREVEVPKEEGREKEQKAEDGEGKDAKEAPKKKKKKAKKAKKASTGADDGEL